MRKTQITKQLYEYAAAYQMTEFSELFTEYQKCCDGELPEANLICAQVKLMAADAGFAEQLDRAGDIRDRPQYPCLYETWQLEDANTFILFDKGWDSLNFMLKCLDRAAEPMERLYGAAGIGMCEQIASEILYFMGRSEEAVKHAARQFERAGGNRTAYLIAGYALMRSYMALNQIPQAQEVLMNIISAARGSEQGNFSNRIYQTIRSWVNLTTGWSGDMPRYYYTPDNIVLPILEDRTSEILKGIDKLSPTEKPFLKYAQLSHRDICTMRQLYMDIFHAAYYFRIGQQEQTEEAFNKACEAAYPNDIIMPFAEYGNQIVPLLEHMCKTNPACDQLWLTKIINRAKQYEEGLNLFRTM